MGIDAIAVLKVPLGALEDRLGKSGEGDPDMPSLVFLRGADGRPLGVSALDDGALVYMGAQFAAEPDELAASLRSRLGPALELHQEQRGVYIFPDVAEPRAKRYGALIAEMGEGGFWVRHFEDEEDEEYEEEEGEAPDLEALARNLSGALPPELLARIQASFGDRVPSSPEELAAVMGSEHKDAIMDAARRLSETLGSDLPMHLPSPEAAPELWAQARALAEELMEDDPEKLAELARRFGGGGDGEAAEEDDDDEDGEPGR